MIEVRGKGGIVVRILKHSIGKYNRIPLITFECTYPRIIHCELLTHGMLNFNSASSRATPFGKMVKNLDGAPVRFGANQAGMQDKGEDHTHGVVLPDSFKPAFNDYMREASVEAGYGDEDFAEWYVHPETGEFILSPTGAWMFCKFLAVQVSKGFFEAEFHKQVYNRLTEAFQMMKTIISGTEFANFFWLRDHDAADPTLQELAGCMHTAAQLSTPEELEPGEWHLPYIETHRNREGVFGYYISLNEDGPDNVSGYVGMQELSLDEAKQVSAARCAAVSFRNVDYDLEKSKGVHERLLGDKRKHGSAFQHQGTPMQEEHLGTEDSSAVNDSWFPRSWEPGVSHFDRDGQFWSAQFRGWIQLRKLIPGENVPGFLVKEDA